MTVPVTNQSPVVDQYIRETNSYNGVYIGYNSKGSTLDTSVRFNSAVPKRCGIRKCIVSPKSRKLCKVDLEESREHNKRSEFRVYLPEGTVK